ncbi:MAG: ABC transporter permease, partial [Alphaproteobacteria bacterium]|nr:ABC transporter permease [Alphaproteobacteria bacterium]
MEQLGARLGLSRPLVLAIAWCVLLFLVLPILVVFPVSVTDQRFLSLPQDGISFRHFEKLSTSKEWLGSIWHSITIAIVS